MVHWLYVMKPLTIFWILTALSCFCRNQTPDFAFSCRVINIWNSLPNWVEIFKARLDKFWYNQDIVHDFRAQLQGTGSRSEVLYE